MRKSFQRAGKLAIVALAVTSATCFAEYPDHPVRVIVPLAAGGPGDILSRVVATKLSEALKQPFIVENRPGANMDIGASFVAKAKPDGYTVLMASIPMTINAALKPTTTPYDPVTSFAQVSRFANLPLVLAVNPNLPVKSVKELIEYAKARPGEVFFGSQGTGSSSHLAGELFNYQAGIKTTHVPYKGIPETLTDVIGGRLAFAFPGAPIALPFGEKGTLRLLGTTGSERTGAAPNLPTIAESGLPGFDVSAWYGMMAPADTPQAIIDILRNEIVRIGQMPDVKERWNSLGADMVYDKDAGAFRTFIAGDVKKWTDVIKVSGIKE